MLVWKLEATASRALSESAGIPSSDHLNSKWLVSYPIMYTNPTKWLCHSKCMSRMNIQCYAVGCYGVKVSLVSHGAWWRELPHEYFHVLTSLDAQQLNIFWEVGCHSLNSAQYRLKTMLPGVNDGIVGAQVKSKTYWRYILQIWFIRLDKYVLEDEVLNQSVFNWLNSIKENYQANELLFICINNRFFYMQMRALRLEIFFTWPVLFDHLWCCCYYLYFSCG